MLANDGVTDRVCCYYGTHTIGSFSRVVLVARCFPLLSGQGLSQGRALEHPTSRRGHDVRIHSSKVGLALPRCNAFLTRFQVHLPPGHGSDPTSPATDHSALPPYHGLVSAVVRFLLFRRLAHHSMAVLRLSAGCQ